MALAKKKQDEKNVQLLKSLVGLAFNKQCFDCNQKGPTYVDLTIGSFICMSCSGVLRGLNPPHRVKSITMSTFTDDEIEFIRSRGNFFCREVWLGNYNSERASAVDLHNDQNKKDYLSVKYERRQWYIEPSPGLFQEAKQLTDSALLEHEQQNQPQTRPGRSYSSSTPIAPLNHHQNGATHSASKIGNLPMPQMPAEQPQTTSPIQTPNPPQPPPSQPPQQIISLFDDDLETALRKQNVPVQQAPAPPQEPPPQQVKPPTFPVNFSSMEPTPFTKAAQLAAQQQAANSTQPPPQQQAPAGSPVPNVQNNNFGGFADFDSAFGKDNQKTAAPPVIMAPPPGRYKALEDLDDLLTLTGSTGVVSSGIDWGTQAAASTQKPQQNHQKSQQASFQTSGGGGGMPFSSSGNVPNFSANFGNSGSGGANSDPFNTSNVFAAAGMAPPQLTTTPAQPPPYSATAPFGHALQPQQTTQPFPPAFGVPQQQPPSLFSGGMMPAQQQPFGAGFGASYGGQPQQQAPTFGMVSNPFLEAAQPQMVMMGASQPQPFQASFPTQPAQPRPTFSNNPFLFN